MSIRATERRLAPEASISLLLKFKSVNDLFAKRASERKATPGAPILLPLKFKSVNVLFAKRGPEREAAPAAPISLPLKFKSVNVVFAKRAPEREAAPGAPTLLPLKFRWVNLILTERAWESRAISLLSILARLNMVLKQLRCRSKSVKKILNERLSKKKSNRGIILKVQAWSWRQAPNSWSNWDWRFFLHFPHSSIKQNANFMFLTTSLKFAPDICIQTVIFLKRLLAFSSDCIATTPQIYKNTWCSSYRNLWSVILISALSSSLRKLKARWKPAKNSWKLLCRKP